MSTSSSDNNPTYLERGLGLKEATALNMIDMVGIAPFIVIPFVKNHGGPQAMIAWVAGALLALMDGFVWSDLAPQCPKPEEVISFCANRTARRDGAKRCRFS